MGWTRMLAHIAGSVDEELLLRNEYLVTENRVLRAQIEGRLRLSDPDRDSLAQIGKRLGRLALEEVATIVSPDTIPRWHRRLIAKKFDGSKNRRYPGRPRIPRRLMVQMARQNRTWGYDRIVGALANLGHTVSDQTAGNILKSTGSPRRPSERDTRPGRSLSARTWTFCRPPTLHHRGLDRLGPRDVLRPLFHSVC